LSRFTLTPEVLTLVAERFSVLAEPARLEILNRLRDGELTVGQIVAETGLGQGNVSKHLQLLHKQNLVARRKDGLHVFYSLADRSVFRLCDIICDRLSVHVSTRRRVLAR
jgi:DNA-binding transcriptional ArsR family regulator